jgi:hypothetical protein
MNTDFITQRTRRRHREHREDTENTEKSAQTTIFNFQLIKYVKNLSLFVRIAQKVSKTCDIFSIEMSIRAKNMLI